MEGADDGIFEMMMLLPLFEFLFCLLVETDCGFTLVSLVLSSQVSFLRREQQEQKESARESMLVQQLPRLRRTTTRVPSLLFFGLSFL